MVLWRTSKCCRGRRGVLGSSACPFGAGPNIGRNRSTRRRCPTPTGIRTTNHSSTSTTWYWWIHILKIKISYINKLTVSWDHTCTRWRIAHFGPATFIGSGNRRGGRCSGRRMLISLRLMGHTVSTAKTAAPSATVTNAHCSTLMRMRVSVWTRRKIYGTLILQNLIRN